jgi:flagellar basal body-associated protein FliL
VLVLAIIIHGVTSAAVMIVCFLFASSSQTAKKFSVFEPQTARWVADTSVLRLMVIRYWTVEY